MPSTHPQQPTLETALQAAKGNLDLTERFKSFTLAGGAKYGDEHTKKIEFHAQRLLEDASKKLDSTITPIKPTIEQAYVERVVAGKIAQLNTPASKESPKLKALWSYVPADARQHTEAVGYYSDKIRAIPKIKILETAETEIGSAFVKILEQQFQHAFQYKGITGQILEKLAAGGPFFVTAKKINWQKNPDFKGIQNALKAYQRLDANGKDALRSEIQQDQTLQAIFKNDGIAALEVAVAKKVLELIKAPKKEIELETAVVAAFAAPPKENTPEKMIATLEQPADLNTPTQIFTVLTPPNLIPPLFKNQKFLL